MVGFRAMASPASRRGGFTLVELAVVLVVLAVMTVAMTSAFSNVNDVRLRDRGRADAEAARQALRAFVLRQKRLPCPDFTGNGDGREDAACNAGADIGWLPYETVGLPLPPQAQRIRYAVHRTRVDLVRPDPRGTTSGHDIESDAALAAALIQLVDAASTPSADAPFYAADDGVAGTTACAGTPAANPAFVLVAPVTDRDGSGGVHPDFDGMNNAMAAGSSRCVAPPSRPSDHVSDDVVVAESATSLLGWLAGQVR